MEDRWVSGALRMSSNTRFLHWAKHSQGMQNSYWGKNKTKWNILFFCKVMQINVIFDILFCLLQIIVLISAGQLQILLEWHRERNELCVKNCWNMYSKIQFIWLIGAFNIPPSNSFCTSCEWNPSESSIEHIVQCGSVGPGWHGVYTASALHTLQCLSLAWYCRFAAIPRPFTLREVNSET